MPGESLFMAFGCLGVSLAGFAGLIATIVGATGGPRATASGPAQDAEP